MRSWLAVPLLVAACGRADGTDDAARDADAFGDASSDGDRGAGGAIKHVFVIAMENQNAVDVYGNADAPYINGALLPAYAHAVAFRDELPGLASEPHYVWMEAGTNVFADHVFTTDDAPSASNSTASAEHLVTQLRDAARGLTWMSYQEGLDAATGACPIAKAGHYAPKHDPFVFFRDVSGSPPSATEPTCVAHHRPLPALADDSGSPGASQVATYSFVTPDLCHDMHGDSGCADGNFIRAGDGWLAEALPPLIAFVNDHDGVVFVTWDEDRASSGTPFLAIGPHVKAGYAGAAAYDHSSLLLSIELILGLPPLATVASADDLADLFEPGYFP